MNNQDKAELKKAQNVLVASNDPAFNYVFLPDKTIEEHSQRPIMVPQNLYDYSVKRDEGGDMKLPSLSPLSLVSCNDNLEDLEAWYAAKYPRLPTEYHGVMARYSSNQLLTKKEAKNAIKKMKKKPEKVEPVGLSVAKGPVIVSFD